MYSDKELERILKQAIIAQCLNECDEIDKLLEQSPEPEYSPQHQVAMEKLFAKARRHEALKQSCKYIKAAGIVLFVYLLLYKF